MPLFELTKDGILTRRIKQLFILQTVVLCLAQDESVMVHWLDTTGQFSADRAKSVLDALEITDTVSTILWPLASPQPSFYREGRPLSHDFKYRSVSGPLKYSKF